jgi:DNA-directed RNA polymerase specialized sigma24 family protein
VLQSTLIDGKPAATRRRAPAKHSTRTKARPTAAASQAGTADPGEAADSTDRSATADSPHSGNGHASGNGHTGNGRHPKDTTKNDAKKSGRHGSNGHVIAQEQPDQELVDRCRQGDAEAWSEMHRRCQAKVLKQIRYTLGDQSRDVNLVEEIAARVWYALLVDDGYLLRRYESEKGNSLGSYLSAIARFEVLRHQRSEYRRRRREHQTQIMRSQQSDEQLLGELKADLKDFLPRLTRREHEYFHHVLLGNNGAELELSDTNSWQLRHRIRRKLLAFLGR